MQDRFKFRLYDKAIGEMVYDVCVGFIKDSGLTDDWVCADTSCGQITYRDDKLKDIILMQSIGLKDKNGKLIYEGDILGGTFENLYVHYCDSCKQFQLKANDYGCMACDGDLHWYEVVEAEEQNELEVIGNIYQDKELLKREG